MATRSLTLLFCGNFLHKSQCSATLTYSGTRRLSCSRLLKSAVIFSGGAAAAVPVTAAATPSGGDLSVLIPISVLLLAFYWVSNFAVADMVAKDLRNKEDQLSLEEREEDTGF